jgi:hypothetical protein
MPSLSEKLADIQQKAVATQESIAAVRKAVRDENSIWELVRRGEQRRSPMFEFAKSLRDTEPFNEMDAFEALLLVRASLKADNATLESVFPQHDDPSMSFLAIWPVVLQRGIFETAVRCSRAYPVPIENSPSENYSAFCSLCSYLQWFSINVPILIPCSTFARVLGVCERTISSYRTFARHQKLLEFVTEGEWKDGRRGADKFQWIGPMPTLPKTNPDNG